MTTPIPSATADVPAWARPFAYGVLALFALCAVAGLEWWPFSGWHLFSSLRTRPVAAVEVVVDGRPLQPDTPGHGAILFAVRRAAAGGDRAELARACTDARAALGTTDVSLRRPDAGVAADETTPCPSR